MTEIYTNNSLDLKPPSYSAYNDENFNNLIKTTLTNSTSGDEFYQKLTELKNEQKKTLLFMEELYNQKKILKEEIVKSEVNLNELKTAEYPFNQRNENYKFNLNTVSAYENRPYSLIEQDVKYLIQRQKESEQISPGPSPKPFDSKPPLPHKSSTVTFQNSVTVAQPEQDEFESISEDLKKIEKIWQEFKFDEDEYNKKSIDFNKKFEKRYKKEDKNAKSLRKRPASVQLEWVPRVTIPEPFSMTIREKIKSENKKKVYKEVQDEREKKIENELRERMKTFKANPVPAHVMVPLYEKLKQEEELRKIKLKKMSQQYMEKVSKPFNLTDTKKKESDRKRRHSYSEGQDSTFQFNAQPLPDFYYEDEDLKNKMKEIEVYKQLKNQIRAIELLKKSKLPSNMKLQEDKKRLEQERADMFLKEVNKLQKKIDSASSKKMSRQNSKKSNSIRKSHDVPDHDSMYRKFVVELETRKAENRKNYKTEPFNLLTETRTRPKNEEKENRNLKRSNSIARLNHSLSVSMDAFPIKYNESHKLRESVNKEKINEIVRKELQKEHIDKIKKLKEKKLHDQIQEKIKYDPKDIEKNVQRQTRKLRLEQKSREEEYEKEIENIQKAIETRKLQIEQIEEANIRKAMEKKYKDVLKKAGIDENEIFNKKSSTQVARPAVYDPTDSWINE